MKQDPKLTNLFKIHAESGEIVAKSSFDYESASEYSFDVFAWNPDAMDTMVGRTRVVVKVIGENEFYPKFVQPSFQFTVSESAKIGQVAGRVEATDADKGPDGQVFYMLVGSSNDRGFYVKSDTGEILVARHLDREIQSRVVLTVLAKNGGSILGNDTDEAQVVISIEDGNDPPAFSRDVYTKSVPEDANPGTVVLAVKAVDKDVRPDNNQFTYSILRGNAGQVFSIHPISGVVQLVGKLDRETESEYNLVVGAVDTGSPPETGTATVNVLVEDVNDNAPEFETPELVGYVTENRGAGASVVVLRPFDKDGDRNSAPFTFSIVGGDEHALTVNPRTGVVRTASSLDRESTPRLKVDVQVSLVGIVSFLSFFFYASFSRFSFCPAPSALMDTNEL
jgi:protocadherin Fat 4